MVLFLIYCWNYRTLIAHLSVIGHSMKIIINQNKNNNIGLLLAARSNVQILIKH